MTEEIIIQLGQNALKTTAMLSAPLLVGTLAVGLIVSIFQAITQINEATLTFIPKMIVVGVIFVLLGPWMMDLTSQYTIELFDSISVIVREGN